MTREEALNAITQFIENYAYGNDLIGLKMAIEVLKEQDKREKEKPKKCPNCNSDLYEYCFMCCYEGEKL